MQIVKAILRWIVGGPVALIGAGVGYVTVDSAIKGSLNVFQILLGVVGCLAFIYGGIQIGRGK